ncbi:MAG TPA: hypothetical protein PKE04_06335, partial [Clostridia bacterium]|nr:hypothetical protein [Clostridia bacterium]
MSTKDIHTLKDLARRYADIALGEDMRERERRARKHNGLNIVRPLVNVFEVPWGELEKDPDMALRSVDARARRLELRLVQTLYQRKHFMADYTLPPYYSVPVSLEGVGYGLTIDETTRDSGTGSSIRAHEYHDQIPDIASLEKVKMPTLSVNESETRANMELAAEVFEGALPVRRGGVGLYAPMWDVIPMLHGAQKVVDDLVDNPEYCHAAVETFTRYFERLHAEYERLNVLESELYYLHCTPALTDDLPAADFDGTHVRLKDVWARGMAQIFAIVSPAMHDEFDLQYMQRLFDRCGLSYYGCCEPLDRKIGLLRKRFKNLRKISITAWADVHRAADEIGSDYVLSYKPNPAFVAAQFDPDAVRHEITNVLEACKRSGTPCEFILKDISTIGGNVN